MRSIASYTGAALAFCWAATANGQPVDISTIDQSKILPYLNSQAIEPVLKTVTGNHLVSVDAQNQAYIVATATNGIRFEIHFHGCENGEPVKCKAMNMISTWDALKKSEIKKVNKTLSEFSFSHPLANAGILKDQRPYVSRYVIADFGSPQGNIVSEFANFIRSATDFSNFLKIETGK